MSAKTCPGCGEVNHWPDSACSGHAPAVPVGVQPEPAEETSRKSSPVLDDFAERNADFLAENLRPGGPSRYDFPGFPVVHPEPGDRAAVSAFWAFMNRWTEEEWTVDVISQALTLYAAASPLPEGRADGRTGEEYDDWNGFEEAAWNLPHRVLVDGLPLTDEQRAAVHEALNDNYQHGHEDGVAETNSLAGIGHWAETGRSLLRQALDPGMAAAERYRDAMSAERPLSSADQEALADLLAAPVVAVPGNEAEASSPGLAADATRPEAGEREECEWPECGFRCAETSQCAPAVPVGVQPASEAATSATDRAVPTRPEPAEEHRGSCRIFYAENRCTCQAGPAVPVVHPEPASESSDSVAELVVSATRSGDRALGLDGYTYVSAECDDHQHAGCPRPDECACHCHEDRSAKWRAGLDAAVIPVRVRKAMALADAEVAAAVAAVRADLADQIEREGGNVAVTVPSLTDWSDAIAFAVALIRGRS